LRLDTDAGRQTKANHHKEFCGTSRDHKSPETC
jgi:hypothetical protein